MTTFNPTMTIEEAKLLVSIKNGMTYIPTEHNKKVIKEVLDEVLKKLHANANQNKTGFYA